MLSRTPASVDLDSDALISAPPEGDASSTVPTPRARGWRSLTRTRPSSDVPRRLRGHQCIGSDRPPAARSDISSCDAGTLRCRCARGLDPRRPGSLSYDRFRTARPPPGRLFSYRAVATFVASGTRRAASTPQASPRTRSPRPHRGGAFNAVALVPSRLGRPNPRGFAAHEDVATEMRTTENCAFTLVSTSTHRACGYRDRFALSRGVSWCRERFTTL